MRVLVFEQWHGGHYFNYLECLVPRLAAVSGEVVVAITKLAASSDLFARQLGHLRNLPNVRFDDEVPIPRSTSRLMYRMQLGRNLIEAIARSKPDYVFLTSADEQVLALPLQTLGGARRRMRELPIEAVIHYKSYTAVADLRERLVSAVQRQLLRTGVFSRLNFVNFLQFEDAAERGLPLARMARAAGDPVPQATKIPRARARQVLGLDAHGRYIGMLGALDLRKAVPEALAAFRAARMPPTDRFVLAGKLAPEHARLIRDEYQDLVRRGTLVVRDEFLTHEELAHACAALDVHCSVYKNFSGLSSVTLKSIAAGVPVVVSDRPGWSRATVKRFGIGHVADAGNIETFSRSLRDALEASAGYVETQAITRLLRFHSIANFTEGLVERLAAMAGRPLQRPVLPWSWVLEALPPERRNLR
jgi:glycosyltransferase involved in cell wall biosynthesis